MKLKAVLFTVFLALSSTGCATVFKGGSQVLTFNSEPQGAEVVVDGLSMGMTPVALNLKKNRYKTVMIRKEGYQVMTQPLATAYDAVALLNVFWDCSTTDLITGNAYEYEPNAYQFNLRKNEAVK